jgi:hypothetical protein
MGLFSLGIGWLLLIVFFINLVGIRMLAGDDRFWLPTVILWFIFFFMYFFVTLYTSTNVQVYEMELKEKKETNEKEMLHNIAEYEKAQVKEKDDNLKALRLLGFQTGLCFFFQAIGYKTTGRRYYRSGSLTFFFLFLVYLVLEFREIL